MWLDNNFTPLLKKKYKIKSIKKPTLFPILKGGPTTEAGAVNTSPFSLVRSARLWVRWPDLLKQVFVLADQIGVPAFVNRIRVVAMADHPTLDLPI